MTSPQLWTQGKSLLTSSSPLQFPGGCQEFLFQLMPWGAGARCSAARSIVSRDRNGLCLAGAVERKKRVTWEHCCSHFIFPLHPLPFFFFFFFLSSPKGETEQKKNINRFSRHKYYRRGALSERGKQEGLGYSLHPSTHPLFCLLSPPDSLSLRHPTVTQGAELMFALVPQQGTKELYHS